MIKFKKAELKLIDKIEEDNKGCKSMEELIAKTYVKLPKVLGIKYLFANNCYNVEKVIKWIERIEK